MTTPTTQPKGYGVRWPQETDLLARVKQAATKNRRSVNNEILMLLEEGLASRSKQETSK